MAIKHIETKEDFDKDVMESEGMTIIDFWAEWCGPCRMLGPVFEAVSEDYENVNFVKVNVDEAPEVAQEFNIMSIPTLIIIKDGEVMDQQMGALTKDQLKSFIDANLEEE